MTDVFDQATEREEKERELAIALQRRKAAVLPDIGCCHYCGEATGAGRRFCDADPRQGGCRKKRVTPTWQGMPAMRWSN